MTAVEERVCQWLYIKLGFKPTRKQVLQFSLHVFPIEKAIELRQIKKEMKEFIKGIWVDNVFQRQILNEKFERIQEITGIRNRKALLRLIVAYVAYLLYDAGKIKDKDKIISIIRYYYSIERPDRRKSHPQKQTNRSL
jgi:hypothetical protein